MRRVTLPDNTASVSLPDGWKLSPNSGGGTIWVTGPLDERIALDQAWFGQDPDDPSYKERVKMHVPPPKQCVVYPHNVDLAKSFPDIFQKLRSSVGLNPIPLQIDHAEQAPASRGRRCANVRGHADPDGKGMRELDWTLCTSTPGHFGMYLIWVSGFTVLDGATDQQRATAAAIVSSFQVNTQALDSMRRNLENQEQVLLAPSQGSGPDIRPIGAAAAARMKAAREANDAQDEPWRNHDAFFGMGQDLSNYILDQTVIQHKTEGNGSVDHGAVWITMADALAKANPSRYEFVDNPDFWQGVDY